MKILPETQLGKWSVRLTVFFIVLISTFFLLVVLGIVTFDDGHWWDATVAVAFSADIMAFFMGFVAVKNKKDQSVLVYLSVLIGICVMLFLLLHSLFISD